MKLAWLTWDEDGWVQIHFSEPPEWKYDKIIQIAYAEVQK